MNEVKELIEELRNKKSRDNRDLLDRSADMIEKLAKELCDKSGCHHKCHDTTDCVVEDEAQLLINQDKSNNFDVKSNEELFKQALVEGLNRHFDKTIEEAKKIEQIEEMIETLKKCSCVYTDCEQECSQCSNEELYDDALNHIARTLYEADYRKQSENTVEILCKVSDTVYQVDSEKIYELEVFGISIVKGKPYYETESIDFGEDAIGKSVFLTREEAEAKMKGGEE